MDIAVNKADTNLCPCGVYILVVNRLEVNKQTMQMSDEKSHAEKCSREGRVG